MILQAKEPTSGSTMELSMMEIGSMAKGMVLEHTVCLLKMEDITNSIPVDGRMTRDM